MNHNAKHYEDLGLNIVSAKGSWVTDTEGTKYLDCLLGFSSANMGHCHPKVVNALVDTLKSDGGSVLSGHIENVKRAPFIDKLAKFVPQLGATDNTVLLKNSGTEAVTAAIKLMRYYGYKELGIKDGDQKIIVFQDNFHGRSLVATGFGTNKKYKEGFGPFDDGFIVVPYNHLGAARSAMKNIDCCGILVEPCQGANGMNIPDPGFMEGLRSICDDNYALLAVDEILVGLGRTGKDFCFQHDDILPDIVCLGKSLGGGLMPVSGIVASRYLMDLAFGVDGRNGSAFGGNPMACTAGLAALQVIEDEKLADKSYRQGKRLLKGIKAINSSRIKEVRGKGLFIAIELNHASAESKCKKLLKLGVIAVSCRGRVIRLTPSLNITSEEIAYLLRALAEVL